MKLLTLNFLTCARKTCKPLQQSFPLHPKDCTLEIVETDFNLPFLCNMLPRLEWSALVTMTNEFGLLGLKQTLPDIEELIVQKPEGKDAYKEGEDEEGTQLAKDLHRLLMETTIQEGKLVCAACGHEYAIKEGIANFLLPSHLV